VVIGFYTSNRFTDEFENIKRWRGEYPASPPPSAAYCSTAADSLSSSPGGLYTLWVSIKKNGKIRNIAPYNEIATLTSPFTVNGALG
jgi:hypothetical protein